MLDPAFVRMARDAPYLSADEELALVRRVRAGDQAAMDRILGAHYRVVLKEAVKRRGYKLSTNDLVQEGVVGMAEALKRFDPTQKTRFSTYALFWIRAAMGDAAMRAHSLVRRNTTTADKSMFFTLRRARATLECGGKLTESEINERLADRYGVDVADIASMSAYLAQGDKALNATVALDHDGELEAIDLLKDDAPGPGAIVEMSLDHDRLAEILARALAQLNERERAIVVARRYAADPEDDKTLDELSSVHGVTRERVRQIEQRALAKMRVFLEAEGVGPSDVFSGE